MNVKLGERWTSSTAIGRWSTLGPYYAMFPVDFARRTVETFCRSRGAVLDPFCGRGTVPYVSMVTGRASLGVDVNPVAYLFAKAKTDPEPHVELLLERIKDVAAATTWSDRVPENEFQKWAWCSDALGFLRAARRLLNWQKSRIDWTLMAIILVHLHGKMGNAISNQMRQTKGMSPDYAVAWWSQRAMHPPEIDPTSYFSARAQWRYGKGIPQGAVAQIILGDSRQALSESRLPFSLLLTSPPYCNVTNYRVDNWIRLWMLGESALPSWETSQRYGHRERYIKMLDEVFSTSANILRPDAIIYVRTDARAFTRDATAKVLSRLWPGRTLLAKHSRGNRSQTSHYGDATDKPGDVDLLLLPKQQVRPEGFEELDCLRKSMSIINTSNSLFSCAA